MTGYYTLRSPRRVFYGTWYAVSQRYCVMWVRVPARWRALQRDWKGIIQVASILLHRRDSYSGMWRTILQFTPLPQEERRQGTIKDWQGYHRVMAMICRNIFRTSKPRNKNRPCNVFPNPEPTGTGNRQCERIQYLSRCIGTIMKFDCTRCGKCCMVSGKHIRIERKLGERDYYCRDLLSNNLVMAHVESPYLPVFRDKGGYREENDQCHFLVRTPEGYACVVYNTRPLSCREFKCCRMRIYRGGKTLSGR